MARFTPQDIGLQEVVNDIHAGMVRLPEFQRDFKWATGDQRELIDSIQKGYPVGTLLFLAVAEGVDVPFGERSFQDVPDRPEGIRTKYLVLDGQQRLSTCYRAFKANTPSVFCIDLFGLYKITDGQPRKVVDFDDLLVLRKRPLQIDRLLYNSDLLPLPFLTDRDSLRERLSQYRQNLASKPETADFATFVDVHVEGYVDVFFDYGFPAVVLPASLDLQAVANVFTKINTTGLKLSAFDLCVATLFPQGVNLREMLKEAHEQDAIRAVDNDGTNILQVVALLSDKPPKKAALPKNIKRGDVDARWGVALEGLSRAGAWLADIGISDHASVPYDALIPPLGAALATIPEPKSPPDKEELKRRIGRWVFQSALAQRYNEGTDVKQAADMKVIPPWFAGIGPLPEFLDEAAVWSNAANKAIRSGAKSRAIVALLNESGPRDFILTAKRLGKGNGRQLSQLHHIFPRGYLRKEGLPSSQIDVVLNLTFLSPESNNFISDRSPSEYVEALIQRMVDAGIQRATAINEVRALFSEHLINEQGWQALLSDDYDGFLDGRALEIRNRVKARFGVQVAVAPEEDQDLAAMEDEEPGRTDED